MPGVLGALRVSYYALGISRRERRDGTVEVGVEVEVEGGRRLDRGQIGGSKSSQSSLRATKNVYSQEVKQELNEILRIHGCSFPRCH